MAHEHDVPWEKIYDFTLVCGREHDPYRFVVTVLEEIDDLVPYDQGLAYCLDEKRTVQAQHLVNIKPRWSNIYREYFSQQNMSGYNLDRTANEVYGMPYIHHINWADVPVNEFVTSYIMARGVKQSLAFVLFDQNGQPRAAFSLDRTRDERFTEADLYRLRLAAAQLGNLYKNFFTSSKSVPGRRRSLDAAGLANVLTKRELEVVELLCSGLSPAHISKTLRISTSTTYKHIAHIHKKLQVSSQQELLVRVLRK